MNKFRNLTLKTPHGIIKTPCFMPDATYGSIQYVDFSELQDLNINEVVTTTLHIEQKLGSDYIKKQGGLHKFFNWERPILTDSGGFQIFSLIHRNPSKYNRITDAGCSFIDYSTGAYNFLSPETSQIIQHKLSSDIRVVLDEPVIGDGSKAAIKKSVKRTTEWALRSKTKFSELVADAKLKPLLTAVIQGGNEFKYRKLSADQLLEIGFDIYGFGGLPTHSENSWKTEYPQGFFHELVAYVAELIPNDSVRYGLGIGSPDDLEFAVQAGWDIFDSVLPTRNGRHGYLYVHKGEGDKDYKKYSVLHIKNSMYESDEKPIDSNCECITCKTTSRRYLRFLFKTNQAIAYRLGSLHNLHYYGQIMSNLRKFGEIKL